MSERICTYESCERAVYARGICRSHYDRGMRSGAIRVLPPPPTRLCSVDGCDRTHYGRGYCRLHYRRLREGRDLDWQAATLEERFWAKVDLIPGGCWEWTAGTVKGYGLFAVSHTESRGAHRVSWEFANGSIPLGMFVCHTCDNRLCVNPAHLFLGTLQDNEADKTRKGRRPTGPGSTGGRPFSAATVREIRSARADGALMRVIAARYGVTYTTIQNLINGKHYADVI